MCFGTWIRDDLVMPWNSPWEHPGFCTAQCSSKEYLPAVSYFYLQTQTQKKSPKMETIFSYVYSVPRSHITFNFLATRQNRFGVFNQFTFWLYTKDNVLWLGIRRLIQIKSIHFLDYGYRAFIIWFNTFLTRENEILNTVWTLAIYEKETATRILRQTAVSNFILILRLWGEGGLDSTFLSNLKEWLHLSRHAFAWLTYWPEAQVTYEARIHKSP